MTPVIKDLLHAHDVLILAYDFRLTVCFTLYLLVLISDSSDYNCPYLGFLLQIQG